MAICKFFIKGYCRYGDSCRFEHPNKSEQRSHSNYDNNRNSRNDSYHGYYNNNTNNNTNHQQTSFSFVNALKQTSTPAASTFGYQQQQPPPHHQQQFTFIQQQHPPHHQQQFSFIQQQQQHQNNTVFWSPSQNQQPQNATGFSFTKALASINGPTANHSFMPAMASNNLTFGQQQPFNLSTPAHQNLGHVDIDMDQEFNNRAAQREDSSNNAFTTNLNQHQNSTGQSKKPCTTYSEELDLSQPEIEAYQATVFSFGCIPLQPPTKAMCFPGFVFNTNSHPRGI